MTVTEGYRTARDVEILRRHILSCPISKSSDAITVALSALDQCDTLISDPVQAPASVFKVGRYFVRLCRLILIDLSLVLLFSSYVILVLLHKTRNELLEPQMKLMEWNKHRMSQELTYYHRVCDHNDLTTLNVQDLLIGDNFTVQDCVHHQMIHGMSIFPNILNSNTSDTLRQYILERNAQLTRKDAIHVLSNTNRWSFGISVHDHPIIPTALEEIATHTVFRPALEQIVGKNPAVIEFTAITSAFGAEDQIWHADVLSSGSAARYAKSFIPSYSFFIPLQDITAEMGATTVCPGTYMCNSQETSFCDQHCFQASGNSVWKKGYGFFMNQQSFHRGAAHVDPNGPHRVLFIVTFAQRPMKRAETRQIGQGGSYSMKWDMWGHCLSDLRDAKRIMTFPWTYLRALGLYKPTQKDWGWDYISMVSMRAANSDTGYKTSDLESFSEKNPLGLPRFLLPSSLSDSDDMTWSDYWLSLLIFGKKALFKINFLVISVYFFILLALGLTIVQIYAEINDTISLNHLLKQFFLFVFFPIRRLLLSYGIIALSMWVLWKKMDSSNWATDIRNENLYTSAFSRHETRPFFVDRPTLHVHRNDILVSTRSISRHFASFNHFLDYHPGNRWLHDESDMIKDVVHYPRSTVLVDYVQFVSRVVSLKGNYFLFQSSQGDWVQMTDDERKWYIKRLVCLKSSAVGTMLDREVDYLLSDTYYSATISRTMSHFSRMVIFSLSRQIPLFLGESLLSVNKFYKIHHSSQMRRAYKPKMKAHKFLWIRDFLKMPLRVRQKFARSLKSPTESQFMTLANFRRFKLGDVVEARYRGKGNEVSTVMIH
jgi:hypothetical protein